MSYLPVLASRFALPTRAGALPKALSVSKSSPARYSYITITEHLSMLPKCFHRLWKHAIYSILGGRDLSSVSLFFRGGCGKHGPPPLVYPHFSSIYPVEKLWTSTPLESALCQANVMRTLSRGKMHNVGVTLVYTSSVVSTFPSTAHNRVAVQN